MTNEHDKEIDSLLRRVAKSESAIEGRGPAGAHIDADEISVFAENALPEKARQRVILHMADCGRCRTILSNVITLNAEHASNAAASTKEVSAGKAIDLSIPWYRKLFAVRGIALAMGAIVILLAGFFAVLVIRNMAPGAASVADLQNANVADNSGPFQELPSTSSDGESGPLAEAEATPFPGKRGEGNDRSEERSNAPAVPPGQQLAKEIPSANEDKFADRAGRRDQAPGRAQNTVPSESAAARPAPVQAIPPAPPPPVVAAEEMEAPKAKTDDRVADKDEKARSGVDVGTLQAQQKAKKLEASRQISGKTFNRRSGVWYDSAYAGQATTNVKRSSPQYRALDSGLRSITDKLSGTVVVVWKAKAYRVD